jgi:TonB family protein
LYDYFSEKIHYPSKSNSNIFSYAVINLFVDSTGIVKKKTLIKRVSPDIDNEVLKAISKIGKLKPAILDSRVVNVNFVLGILIVTDTTDHSIKVTPFRYHPDEESHDNIGFVKPMTTSQQPTFPGGVFAFSQFLRNNIVYPPNARQNNIQGRVITKFVVERDGSISNIEVISSPDDDLSMEAIRVIKKSPRFYPGMENGRTVRCEYTLPITFTL